MSKRERTPTRRLRRLIGESVERGRTALQSRWGQVAIEAAWSLQMAPKEVATGMAVLDGCEPSSEQDQRAADMLMARTLDMLEANGRTHFGDSPIEVQRAELVRRQGPGFLIEVAETGKPASSAALRIASLLLVLLVFFAGASPSGAAVSGSSHKIHGVNLARALAWLKNAACRTGKRGGWGPRFSHGRARRLRTGRRSARSSSRRPASLPSSLSGLISARTPQPSSSAPASPSTPSDAPADRSSDRHTLPIRRRPHSASSTADRAEAWATYRLRVQNLLLSLPAEGGAA